jgi:uncharacterized membrane protein YsdA (DUF1294 family)
MDTETPTQGTDTKATDSTSPVSIDRNANETRSLLTIWPWRRTEKRPKVLRAPEPLPVQKLGVVDPRQSTGEAFTWIALVLLALPVLMLVMYFGFSWVFAVLAGINIATLGLFFYDRYASHHRWLPRVPETTFLYFIFFGGTPSAILANRILYFNRQLPEVHWSFWLMILFQVMAFLLIWLLLG